MTGGRMLRERSRFNQGSMSVLRNRHWRPTLTAGIFPALISSVHGPQADLQVLENLVRRQEGFANHHGRATKALA